jgi:acyl dehydratase
MGGRLVGRPRRGASVSELLYFEDFGVGQTFALGSRALKAEEMIAFAREFDPQPQHLDPVAAKQSILGGLAASGWYLAAFAMRMMVDGLFIKTTSLGSPGVEEVQWRRPVLAGDTLTLEGEVLETRPSSRPDRGFVRFRFVMRRGDERVMMYVCTVMFRRKGSA